MDYQINVRLYARKVHVSIERIKVPKEFGTPSLKKIIGHCESYFTGSCDLDPILVDGSLTLIDGYISLLIAQAEGKKKVEVYRIVPRFYGYETRKDEEAAP